MNEEKVVHIIAPSDIVPLWFVLAIVGVIIGAIALVIFIVEWIRKR